MPLARVIADEDGAHTIIYSIPCCTTKRLDNVERTLLPEELLRFRATGAIRNL